MRALAGQTSLQLRDFLLPEVDVRNPRVDELMYAFCTRVPANDLVTVRPDLGDRTVSDSPSKPCRCSAPPESASTVARGEPS